jgi:hypothetical protein
MGHLMTPSARWLRAPLVCGLRPLGLLQFAVFTKSQDVGLTQTLLRGTTLYMAIPIWKDFFNPNVLDSNLKIFSYGMSANFK